MLPDASTNAAIINQNVGLLRTSRQVSPSGSPGATAAVATPSGNILISWGASFSNRPTIGIGIISTAPPTMANADRHPYPAISDCTTGGITMDPTPRPAIISPNASPLRRLNHRDTTTP